MAWQRAPAAWDSRYGHGSWRNGGGSSRDGWWEWHDDDDAGSFPPGGWWEEEDHGRRRWPRASQNWAWEEDESWGNWRPEWRRPQERSWSGQTRRRSRSREAAQAAVEEEWPKSWAWIYRADFRGWKHMTGKRWERRSAAAKERRFERKRPRAELPAAEAAKEAENAERAAEAATAAEKWVQRRPSSSSSSESETASPRAAAQTLPKGEVTLAKEDVAARVEPAKCDAGVQTELLGQDVEERVAHIKAEPEAVATQKLEPEVSGEAPQESAWTEVQRKGRRSRGTEAAAAEEVQQDSAKPGKVSGSEKRRSRC